MKLGDRGEPDFIGPSGNFCFPSSQSPVPLSMKESIVQSADAKDFSSKFSNDYEIKRKLTTVFMTGLNPIHHFLPPSTFLEPDLYPFDDPGINLLHSATFAAGALLSPVLLDRKAGDAFASQAEVSAISACRLQPSVIVVQALSIIAWRELSLEHNNLAQIYLCNLISFTKCSFELTILSNGWGSGYRSWSACYWSRCLIRILSIQNFVRYWTWHKASVLLGFFLAGQVSLVIVS